MLALTVRLLREQPEVLSRLRWRFTHVLVDELQVGLGFKCKMFCWLVAFVLVG